MYVPAGPTTMNSFATAAVAAGASSLLVDHHLRVADVGDVTQLIVDDTRLALGPIAAPRFGDPRRDAVVGITGTNGKTTTSMLIGASSVPPATRRVSSGRCRARSRRRRPRSCRPASPSSRHGAAVRGDGGLVPPSPCTVSTARGSTPPSSPTWGSDHLDLHGTVEAYFRAKALLFQPGCAVVGVVNVDDAHGRKLRGAAPIEIVPFSLDDATAVEVTASSVAFNWRGEHIDVPLGGAFNVINAIGAATTAEAIGIGMDDRHRAPFGRSGPWAVRTGDGR